MASDGAKEEQEAREAPWTREKKERFESYATPILTPASSGLSFEQIFERCSDHPHKFLELSPLTLDLASRTVNIMIHAKRLLHEV